MIENIKKDPVHLIVKYGQCTNYVKTNCPVGSEINKKMIETHKLLKTHTL